MAETVAAPNNRPVNFSGKRDGVNREFVQPKRAKKTVKSAIKRGLVSPKAAARHLKGV